MTESLSTGHNTSSNEDTFHAQEVGKVVNDPVDATDTKASTPSKGGRPAFTDQSKILTRKELRLVFLGLCLVLFMASLDQTIISVMTPTVANAFDSPQNVSWIATIYLLASTAMQPIYGKLSDIFGRKPILMSAMFFFLGGSLICGVAGSMLVLIIGRGVAGLGAGGMLSLINIVISDVVPMRERGKYQGIIGSVWGSSSVLGPLLGGALAESLSWGWRLAFLINLPIGIISMIVLALVLRLPSVPGGSRDKLKRIDFLGSGTLVIGVICLLLATNWGGNQYAWNSAIVIILFTVGFLFVFIFIFVELRISQEPILPFRLFKNRTVSACLATVFFQGGGFMAAIFYVPLYFQMVMHDSATRSGIMLLPMVFGMMVTSMGSGLLISKTGKYRIYIWISFAIFAVGLGLLSLWNDQTSIGVQVGFLLVLGLGLGGTTQTIIIAGQSAVTPQDIATVTAMLSFFRTLGGVVNVAICGSMINNILSNKGLDASNFFIVYNHQAEYASALQTVFHQCVAWPIAALLAALAMKHNELRTRLGAQDKEDQKVKDGEATTKEISEKEIQKIEIVEENKVDQAGQKYEVEEIEVPAEQVVKASAVEEKGKDSEMKAELNDKAEIGEETEEATK